MSLQDAVRFFSWVDIRFFGCWEWRGTPSQKYGTFQAQRLVRKAHRISYELAYGRIPDGMVVMHLCDNTRCVRPEHLRAAVQRDNVLDMDAKGRRRNQNSGRLFCVNGHYDWIPRAEKEGGRRCRACMSNQSAERRRRHAVA